MKKQQEKHNQLVIPTSMNLSKKTITLILFLLFMCVGASLSILVRHAVITHRLQDEFGVKIQYDLTHPLGRISSFFGIAIPGTVSELILTSPLVDDRVVAIVQSFSELRHLHIGSDTSLSQHGIESILGASSGITSLWLDAKSLSKGHVAAISKCRSLKELEVGCSAIDKDAFSSSSVFPSLERINFLVSTADCEQIGEVILLLKPSCRAYIVVSEMTGDGVIDLSSRPNGPRELYLVARCDVIDLRGSETITKLALNPLAKSVFLVRVDSFLNLSDFHLGASTHDLVSINVLTLSRIPRIKSLGISDLRVSSILLDDIQSLCISGTARITSGAKLLSLAWKAILDGPFETLELEDVMLNSMIEVALIKSKKVKKIVLNNTLLSDEFKSRIRAGGKNVLYESGVNRLQQGNGR